MIPKKIHYCWFGRKQIPDKYKNYIESWKTHMPSYDIIEWNESNFDVTSNCYCHEAFENKKWAFVSDYARLKIIHDFGGIYLDVDVEMVRDLTPLIKMGNGFIGFQNFYQINTGLGFAAAPKNRCVYEMLKVYEQLSFFVGDGKMDLTPCPVFNTVALRRCGLVVGREASRRIQHLEGLSVFPIEFFNPINVNTMKCYKTNNTYLVNHYAASWISEKRKRISRFIKKLIPAFILDARTNAISRKAILKKEKELYGIALLGG